jgi:hypothetical protein
MGQYLLIIITTISLFYGIIAANISSNRLEQIDNSARHYNLILARNCASSLMNVSLSKISYDNDWNAGLYNKSLNGAIGQVTVEDHTNNATLSFMERIVHSSATFADATKTIDVHCGLPPDIENVAAYATGPITKVTITDEAGKKDNSLKINNAPFMVPFDLDALEAIAQTQGQVENGDFSPGKNYPNGSFYYSVGIPNVTIVKGNLTVNGGRTVYGIYVVYGDVRLNGSARVEGCITIPESGNIETKGGGNPKEYSVTGGVVINGNLSGTGNHVKVRYWSEYMAELAKFQLPISLYVITWKESPSV